MLAGESRLRHQADFKATMRDGVRCSGANLVLHARRGPRPVSRVGLVVSRSIGNSVRRNRVKRRLRHLASAALAEAPFPVDLVVRALPPAANATSLGAEFGREFSRCLDRLGA